MKIAIYVRKSVYKENSESIETQKKMCREYFRGEHEFTEFEDEGYSGGNTNRPAFKRLMSLVEINTFDIVAIYKVDRIARNIVDFCDIYRKLECHKTKIVSIAENFDASTPMGKLTMMILACFADMERENIRQRVKDNMLSLARKGCWTGGVTPKGYNLTKIDGKTYLELLNEEFIIDTFNSYLKTGSLYGVLKHMKQHYPEMAYKTRDNTREMLRNPLYVKSDKTVSNYLRNKGFEIVGKENGKGYLRYDNLAIVSKHNAVVSPELFLKVNMKIDEAKENHFKKKSKVYWLSGVLVCPFCGSEYVIVNSGCNSYYSCKNRINRTQLGLDTSKEKCKNGKYVNATILEDKISEFVDIKAKLSFNEFSKDYITKDFKSKVPSLENKIKKNEIMINNLVDKLALLSNNASKPIMIKIEELTNLNGALKSEIETEKLKELETKTSSNPKDIFNNIYRFKSIKTAEEKRQSIRAIFKSLTYNPYDDSLEYEYV